MTKDLVHKLAAMEKTISEERGPFTFFAWFLRENSTIGKWDLLVAAPWLRDDSKEDLEFMIGKVRQYFSEKEFLTALSLIIIFDWKNPHMDEVYDLTEVEHGLVEVKDEDILGQTIKRGYIITSKKAQPLAA